MDNDDEQTQEVLSPIEQAIIPFHGRELVAVRLADGRVCAVLRWLCEGMHLEITAQVRRIRRKTALRDDLVNVRVQTPGGPQTMPALTLHGLPGWLYGVDEARIASEEAREAVVLFQREATDILAEHFASKRQPALPAPQSVVPADPQLASQVAQIAEQIDTMSGAVTLMREHLAALLSLPAQVEGLSAQMNQAVTMLTSLAERQEAAEARIADTDAQLAAVDARTQRLSPAHTRQIQEMVDRMVRDTKRLPIPLTYMVIYGRLKHRFRVGSYKEVADNRFDDLMAYLRGELSRATSGDSPEQGSLF
jgi:hypothetical protein